ncbi:hypothetical protein N8T09_23150 [Enterobacter hormaechei subsp. xiangfangensis]|nr:hypothetical protein [Enterobacter hormaechei subsp. xiangfangensis]MCU2422230.1 hypothetical protein [Enterobacter hormaechei subsp. xiangfangensis]MCU2640019.1 hypothetical protein [Enterobacter hormaechei subsp. xiangfangensis]MCU2779791.1 hypothetical protein [Enterobacter hormaechei subsp. xiangfangensis]MCU2844353.1 hypothetical protein [Enterobacter hormaechei subsp. xiangfangensis]
MSREGSLDLLLEVEENLETMKKTQQIRPVKVKSMLEHLRSSLEYVTNDAYDKYVSPVPSKRPKIFFPYGEQKFIDNFFTQKLKINPPSSSPLYEVFNSIQDFRTGEDTLTMMCNLTNEVKHRKPIPLEEESSVKDINVRIDGFGIFNVANPNRVVFKNNSINGQKLEDFTFENGKLERTGNGIPVNIVITEDKKIRFHGEDYEVVPFIESCLIRLRIFINEAYDVLENC